MNFRTQILISIVSVALLAGSSGCQKRYQPAKWRPAAKKKTTLPGDMAELASGQMGTLPGTGTLPSSGTLPSRGNLGTLPLRNMGTMPNREGTLPSRGNDSDDEILSARWGWPPAPVNRPKPSNRSAPIIQLPLKNLSSLPARGGSTLPNRGWSGAGGGTLPERRWNPNNGSTLPSRFQNDFLPARGTTLPGR